MNDILPARRAAWAERFLLMAMWCQAAVDAKHRGRARDLMPVAHALTGDAPLDDDPDDGRHRRADRAGRPCWAPGSGKLHLAGFCRSTRQVDELLSDRLG